MPVIGCVADNGHFYTLVLLFRAGYQTVKVALIQMILNDAVLLKLAFGKGFCNGSGDFSLICRISASLNCRKASSLEAQSAMVMGICRLACRVA